MPIYNFVCKKCLYSDSQIMSIEVFLSQKDIQKICPECKQDFLFQKIKSANSQVEKDKERFLMEIQEEVRKTVEKIKSGDEKAIADIYGDTANPYKNNK